MKTALRELGETLIGIDEGKSWQLMPKSGGVWRDPIDTTPVQAIERNYKIRLKPWELTDTVNGHTLPLGASWHRNDFDEDMLPGEFRPLMSGEPVEPLDQCFVDGRWHSNGTWGELIGSSCHHRTTRPIPFALTPEQIADGWVMWGGGECPVEPESIPFYILRKDGEISNDSTAGRLAWEHRESLSDIIAYKPDPYGHLRQALAEGKVIQCNDGNGNWLDIESPAFDAAPDQYRIKEQQWITLGPIDISPRSCIKMPSAVDGTWFSILKVNSEGVAIDLQGETSLITWDKLKSDGWLINRPGSDAWTECRKQAP